MKLNILLAYALIVVPVVSGLGQTDTAQRRTSLTLATIYSTNASYYGQTAERRLPYLLMNATMRTPFNLYLTAGGYKLLTMDDGVSAWQAGAGFEFKLGDKMELDMGYIRSFYADGSPLLQASNTDNVSASLAVDHAFKTMLTGDYMFGQEEDYFVTLGNSKRITIGRVTSKDLLVTEPGIDLVAGTQRYYQAYVTEQRRLGRLIDLLPIISPGQPQPDTALVQSTSFKMLSYTLQVPVYYYRSSYAIAATYQLSVLDPNVSAISRKPRSFLNVGFYYQF